MCGTRRQRLWVEQEGLRSSRPSAITPRGEDSVTGHYAPREVRQVVEGCILGRYNHAGKQRVFRMHVGASLDSRDQRYANIGYVFDNLGAFVVNLAPDAGIGDVAEG